MAEEGLVDACALTAPAIDIGWQSNFLARMFGWTNIFQTKHEDTLFFNECYPFQSVRSAQELRRLANLAKKQLSRVQCPVLECHSELDDAISPKVAHLIAQKVSGPVEIQWYNRSGHTMPLDVEGPTIIREITQFFEKVKKWANKKFPHYKIFNTICDSTSRRQAEVKRFAKSVDAVIVVGGHNSANTQRLAEIAKESGKPSYHIESENELDLKALASAKNIGLTAGASTPNWIIKRVYRTLESSFFKKEQRWRKAFFSIQRSLLLTNIYVSLGAGCLCYACTRLQAIEHHFPHVLISILYVLSMHILNNMIGSKADHYNDPERALFYRKHKVFLSGLAVFAGSAGLIAAYLMGITSFLILFLMSLLGLSYNIRLLPEGLFGGRYRRIRDIPGSKTVLIAAAWGIVTSIFPTLSVSESIGVSTIIVFFLSACIVFVRTAFFDTLDMQGDRIVGRATIPILLGEKRTTRLLKIMLTLIFATLLLSSAFQLISTLGFLLTLCPVFIFVILSAYERGYMLPGIRLEFLVETHFILAGIITIIWSWL